MVEKELKLPNVDDVIIDIQDLIAFNFSLHDFQLKNLKINDTIFYDSQLINLYADDKIRMTIANFSGGLSANYSYVSDPPIVADIGEIDFNSPSFGMVIDG